VNSYATKKEINEINQNNSAFIIILHVNNKIGYPKIIITHNTTHVDIIILRYE
jgi:hypothetical protein